MAGGCCRPTRRRATQDGRRQEKTPLTRDERRAVLALVGVCALVTFFWAAYDQQGNTLVLWAEDFTDRSIDLYFWKGEIPSAWFLALNPLMIFLFTPLLVRVWARQAARGTEPFADQQDGVRLRLRGARQPAHGGGGRRCRRRQGEPDGGSSAISLSSRSASSIFRRSACR